MSELLWHCKDGIVLSSARNGLALSVSRAEAGDGFRYQLLHPIDPAVANVSVASGYRPNLIDAMLAAETIANGWGHQRRRDG